MAPIPPPWKRPTSVLMVAGFPPPAHGSSHMNARLHTILATSPELDLTAIRLGRPKVVSEVGALSPRSVLYDTRTLLCLASRRLGWRRWDVAYLAISQQKPALFRDVLVWRLLLSLADRVIVHVHGGELPHAVRGVLAPVARRLGRRTEFWILSAKLGLGDFASAFPGARAIEVVPNATECACVCAPKTVGSDEVRVGYLGTVRTEKGVTTLLEGVRLLAHDASLRDRLSSQRIRATFELAGPARPLELRVEVERSCAEINEIGGPVISARYLGSVDSQERCRLLGRWDAVALISNFNLEGQPLALIEAAAHHCAIISNEYRALTDVNVDGVTGWVVEGGRHATAPDVARVLRDAVTEPSELRARGLEAAKLAQERFSAEAFRERVLGLLGKTK